MEHTKKLQVLLNPKLKHQRGTLKLAISYRTWYRCRG